MSQQQNHALEVKEELVKLGVITDETSLINYNQMSGGGAACILFELCFENPSKKFIQKIDPYNNTSDQFEDYEINSRFEYNNLKTLFENGFDVPQPYFLKLAPNTRNLPYFVMEKVEGLRLVEVKGKNPDQYEQLIEKLLKALFKIHSLNPQLFPSFTIEELQKDPYASIEEKLRIHKIYLKGYPEELKELVPVVEWLEKNKINYPCEKLVVTHGDFHSFNIIVEENKTFKILDWGSLALRDFRMDVSYTATTESYFDEDQTFEDRMKRVSLIVSIYEKISGRKIEGLDYFMILGCIFNLIRLYGAINNPNITGVKEEDVAFFHTVKDYFLFCAYFIREICNVELRQIGEYFTE
jgi:aminoglycoside phosphotransferase (APT) family kinase protein